MITVAVVIFFGSLVLSLGKRENGSWGFTVLNTIAQSEDEGCPKVALKEEVSVTWNEWHPIGDNICLIFTMIGRETICSGSGNIPCCAGIKEYRIESAEYGPCP